MPPTLTVGPNGPFLIFNSPLYRSEFASVQLQKPQFWCKNRLFGNIENGRLSSIVRVGGGLRAGVSCRDKRGGVAGSVSVKEIDILLPNNQRQLRTLQIQREVLPYALC